MKYVEFIIYTERPERLEIAQAVLMMHDIIDVVVNDPRDVDDLIDKKNAYDWDYIDDSVLQQKESRPSVTVYLDDTDEVRNMLAEIEKEVTAHIADAETVMNVVCDDDWKDNWKEYFKPAKVTERIVVKPTWEEYEAQDDEIVIEIDPGMAFGTGTHETTSLCLALMEKYIKSGDKVLDVGCGSGILAIAAGLLGADDVLGIEIDPVAVEIGKENVVLNKLDDKVKVVYGDLTKGVDFKADMVAANLMADLVKLLSGDVMAHIEDDGIYISSGILAELADDVSSVIKSCGFDITEVIVKGEWCAIAARPRKNCK